MKAENEIVTSYEFFELRLGVEDSRISSKDLISYLTNIETMFNSVNKVLNIKDTLGYDSIEIDVLALEKGSFKIPISIKKIASKTLIGVATTVIGEITASAIKSIVAQRDPQRERIETQYIIEDRDSIESIKRIADLALGNNSIKSLDITYEEDGQKTNINMTREEIKTLSEVDIKDDMEETCHLLKSEQLEIVSPVFIDEPSKWKVKLRGKTISATIIDRDFLDMILQSEISFAKGDAIVADIEILEKKTKKRKSFIYRIIAVHNYPRYSRVLKKNIQ